MRAHSRALRSVHCTCNQSINRSINQSNNQSINRRTAIMFPMIYRAYSVVTRPFNQSQGPLIDEHHSSSLPSSINQSVDQPIAQQATKHSKKQSKQTNNQSVDSDRKQSVANSSEHKQSVNQSNNQSTNQSANQSVNNQSIIDHEVSKFTAMAEAGEWWNENGEAGLLHKMNPVRINFIRNAIINNFQKSSPMTSSINQSLSGLRVLDVGCGGGLLCEPLSRLGGEVTGIDASSANIEIARAHAALDQSINQSLTYRHVTAEALQAEGAQFDVVISSEVVEHVGHPDQFTQVLSNLVKPGGLLIMSTMNRTGLSYIVAILTAEYVLNLVPRGTHEWSKFVTPHELKSWINQSKTLTIDQSTKDVHQSDQSIGMKINAISGMVFDPIKGRWTLETDRLEVNYILCAKRPA